jgi:hypothetical protein
MGLLILTATLIPFASTSALSTNVATAAINLVVGIAIASLTSPVASSGEQRGRLEKAWPDFGAAMP